MPGNEDVLCRCGNVGCLEAVAGGRALAQQLQRARASRRTTAATSCGSCAPASRSAARMVREAGRSLGRVLAGSVNFFNPAVIILGGDLGEAHEQLLAGVREVIFERSLPLATRDLRTEPSRLGDRAGVVGAAIMVIEHVLAPDVVDRALQSGVAACAPIPLVLTRRTRNLRVIHRFSVRLPLGSSTNFCLLNGKSRSRVATRPVPCGGGEGNDRALADDSPCPVDRPVGSRPAGRGPGRGQGREYKVMVFTRAVGEQHASTAAGVKAIKDLGKDGRFIVNATADPTEFRADRLKQFRAVVFLNTSGDVLTTPSRRPSRTTTATAAASSASTPRSRPSPTGPS